MDNYSYVQNLYQMAERAANQGDYSRAYIARAELNRVTPSAVNSLWQAEAGRMLGLLPVQGSFAADEISVLKADGNTHFSNLLATAIELGALNTSDLANFDLSRFSGNDRLVRSIAYAILHRKFQTSELDDLFVAEHPVIQIRNLHDSSVNQISDTYIIDVSRFLSESAPETKKVQQINVESAQIIRLTNSTVWVESDAMFVDGQFVIDQAGKLGGHGVNFSCDVRIMSASNAKVIVTTTRPAGQLSVKRGLFLAYPMTHAWGHFFSSILCRLAFALEIHPDGDLDVILSSRVTQAGRDAIQMLHPKLRLHFFDPNTEILVEDLLVVPSRGFKSEEILAGYDIDQNRVVDIEAMRLIRQRFQQIFKTDSSTGSCVYWSRGTANYRKGHSDKILEHHARGLGLDIVDLGNLSLLEQGTIVAEATTSFGFYGSHLTNVATMAPVGSSHLVITNDRPYEWQTLHLVLSELLEVEPQIVQGQSRLFLPYYAPENYHSPTELEFNQIESIYESMSYCRDLNSSKSLM
jgi:hypothetical protein